MSSIGRGRSWNPYRASRELELAQIAVGLGVLSERKGQKEAAISHYTFARTVWEKHVRSGSAKPEAWLRLAEVYSSLGQHHPAQTALQQGLVVAERELGPGHPRMADMLLMYAKALRQSGYKDEAASIEKQAKAVTENSQERLARHTVAVDDLVRETQVRR